MHVLRMKIMSARLSQLNSNISGIYSYLFQIQNNFESHFLFSSIVSHYRYNAYLAKLSISQTVKSKIPGALMKRSDNQTETDNEKVHALAVRVPHSVIEYSSYISHVSQLFILSKHSLIWCFV